MVPDAAADDLGGLMLHQFFTLVATLHTHIFRVRLHGFFRERTATLLIAGGWPGLISGWAAFVLLLKTQGGFCLAADSIVDFFLDRDTLLRQSGAGRIQFVGFRSRLLDIRLQRRVCPFFLGQFQTGGGTVQAIFAFGGSCGFCCPFLLFFLHKVRSHLFPAKCFRPYPLKWRLYHRILYAGYQ